MIDPVYGEIPVKPFKAKEKMPIKVKAKSTGSSFATSVLTFAHSTT